MKRNYLVQNWNERNLQIIVVVVVVVACQTGKLIPRFFTWSIFLTFTARLTSRGEDVDPVAAPVEDAVLFKVVTFHAAPE